MAHRDLATTELGRIELEGTAIDYVLARRRGRRGAGLRVDANGLRVGAALTMPLAQIEAFIRSHARWVLGKTAEWSARRAPEVSWVGGERLPYLGGAITLALAKAARMSAELEEGVLRLALPLPEREERVRKAAIAWYKRAALEHLTARTRALALAAGLPPPRVMLSLALARWGSCNTRREVRLAWRLVKAPPELIDYVICHELAHLRHMNHSSAFWREVGRQCPDYRDRRARLHATDHLYRSF